MAYSYASERQNIFTEEGQVLFLKIRDNTKRLIQVAGAARLQEIIKGCAGYSWQMIACVDRLVEIGELREITQPNVMGQHRVFVASGDRP